MVVSAGAVVLLCLPIGRILQAALSRVVTLRSPVARNPGPGTASRPGGALKTPAAVPPQRPSPGPGPASAQAR